MKGCVLCMIAEKTVPSTIVHRDDATMAIEDINPQAPTHVLVFPLEHVASVAEMDDAALVGRLLRVATGIGRDRGGDEGFRLVINTGPNGGQTIDHMHVHVLAGRAMEWPPG